MTSSRSRRNRNRRRAFNGSPADHDDTQWIGRLRTDDIDGATIAWPPGPGLPGGIAYLAAVAVTGTGQDTQPLARLRAEPRYAPPSSEVAEEEAAPLALLRAQPPAPDTFPALPAAPEPGCRPVLAPAEITMSPAIGDDLRLPVVWCEMGGCINWHLDREALGERDARDRATKAGWRTDALGRLACPDCQQGRSDYRTPQPVAWHHPEVARRWHAREPLSDTGAFRLSVEAQYARRVSREHPALAAAMAGATRRTAGAS